MTNSPKTPAGRENARRLYVYNGGFLTQPRIRRILDLAGWNISLGKPGPDDWIGVWGKSPTAPRGEAVSDKTNAPILRVEDSFLRSVLPGRSGSPPIGLNIDQRGVHFDSATPSELEHLLATHPLDDSALLNRARAAADRLRRANLSKYNAFDPAAAVPDAPYVLVIDQTKGDASIAHGGANAATFREMLVFAQTEHPANRIVIKTHPETAAGHREGHFGPDDETDRITLLSDPVCPWKLMEGAIAVYTVSSQLGFEAIYAGHKPRVFGQPFYSGWGLTTDEYPVARRERKLTRAQLFAAAMILYPTWYDPNRDRLCDLEDTISALEAETRAWREDHEGYDAAGISRWKHQHMQAFFGQTTPVSFVKPDAPANPPRKRMIWGSAKASPNTLRIEDGFLRSRGLGAKLIPPLSLVCDDIGIYYDPTGPSRLEHLIAATPNLSDAALQRAETLIRRLNRSKISKYNLPETTLPDLPEGYRILVPGQVEDDASILKGCGDIRTNLELLIRTRADNPDAMILYKPHPDVEAGLRLGKIADETALEHADLVLKNTNPIALINAVDEVWTLTSLLGFEALIRTTPVTCLGTPFYAGWGLTADFGDIPQRRNSRPTLAMLVHACLIDYPRYFDPVSKRPCPVEVALDRLETGNIPKPGRFL
ncbi:MAG: capsular polysaccharide biosynthesis protein, partial [Paracoccaceae bacterium]